MIFQLQEHASIAHEDVEMEVPNVPPAHPNSPEHLPHPLSPSPPPAVQLTHNRRQPDDTDVPSQIINDTVMAPPPTRAGRPKRRYRLPARYEDIPPEGPAPIPVLPSDNPSAATPSIRRVILHFGIDPSYRSGLKVGRLPKIGFVPENDDQAFSFLDPELVICRCHLIPAFADGRTVELLRTGVTAARPIDEVDDWAAFYVNMYVIIYVGRFNR